MNSRLLLLLILVFTGMLCAEEVKSSPDDPSLITVEESLWGFDGTIVAQHFNPFSVRLKNSTPIPWKGTLQLQRGLVTDRIHGLVLEQSIELGPEESRWFQFTPYVADSFDSWHLVWGKGEHGQLELNSAPAGPQATVLIYDPDAVTPAGGILRRLPENLFPQSITATSPLRGVILAHTPFWTGARARTFLEWLQQGGRVYLLHNPDGKHPVFPETLAVLNNPASQFSVGSGTVKRVPLQVNDLDMATAQRELFWDDVPPQTGRRVELNVGFQQSGSYVGWARHEYAFRELRSLANFTRPWLLIYFCVFLYLLLLYPGCYRLGTEAKRVRWFYALFLGGVLLFSGIFLGLGQVGGEERSRLRTTGVATHLGNGVFSVNQWTMACVRDEGDYELQVPGNGPLITSCEEAGDTRVLPGRYDLDENLTSLAMASTSTQSFVERLRISTQIVSPQLLQLDGSAGRIDTIQVEPGPHFKSEVRAAWLVRDQTVYPLDVSKPIWTLDRLQRADTVVGLLTHETKVSVPLWVWFYPQVVMFLPSGGWGMIEEARDEAEQAVMKRLQPLLIAEAFNQSISMNSRHSQVPAGRVRLLIHRSTMPEEFRHTGDDFPDQRGSLLFVYDLPDLLQDN